MDGSSKLALDRNWMSSLDYVSMIQSDVVQSDMVTIYSDKKVQASLGASLLPVGIRTSIFLWNAKKKIWSKTLEAFRKVRVSSNMQLFPADCQKTKDVPLHWLRVPGKAPSWLFFQSNASAKADCREERGIHGQTKTPVQTQIWESHELWMQKPSMAEVLPSCCSDFEIWGNWVNNKAFPMNLVWKYILHCSHIS